MVLALGVSTSVQAEPVPDVVRRIDTQTRTLERDYLAPALQEQRVQITARLNDGLLLYQARDYDRAAMVLLDVAENPAARGLPAYREAVYHLADALFRIRNFRGASVYFTELLRIGSAKERQQALGRLVEVALATHDPQAADRYLVQAEALLATAAEPELIYAVARYRYQLGQLAESKALFARVPLDGSLGLQAAYFGGVVAVRQGDLAAAQIVFQRIVDQAKATTQDAVTRRITDLALLGLGRLAYERGELEAAIAAYARVPQTSGVFDQALNETVWIEVKRQDFLRALRKLEVQLMVTSDGVDGVDARLLQAKLLKLLGRFDEASRAFEEVLVEFGPVRDEMSLTLRRQGDKLESHLNAQIGEDLSSIEPSRFLPPKAARFSEGDLETARAVNLVTDIALQRRDLDEAERTAEQLIIALDSGSRIKIFPRLQEGWLRAMELQHQLVLLRARLNDDGSKGIGARTEELVALQQGRRRWQKRYEALPHSAVAFRARTSRVDDEMVRLDKESFRLSVEVQGIEAQLAAVDKYVRDTIGAEIIDDDLPALRQVRQERVLLETLKTELQALARAVEAERIGLGVNDDAALEDDRVRTAFLDALRSEARWLLANGGALPVEVLGTLDELDTRLDAFLAKVRDLVDARIAEIRAQVDQERGALGGHRRDVAQVSQETESIGGVVAARAFRQVLDRIGAIVLEADVGLIDVAWRQKQDQSEVIGKLLERQQVELELLDRAFREVSLE